jgi:hypothetical protein
MNQTINASNLELSISNPDGTASVETLTPREISLFEAVDRALRDDPRFVSSYPEAVLEHIECLRAMPETSSGHAYLRYRFSASVTEFWGRVSRHAHLNFRSGIGDVSLKAAPNSSQTDPNGGSSKS